MFAWGFGLWEPPNVTMFSGIKAPQGLHLPYSLKDAEFNVAGINVVHADTMDVIEIANLRRNKSSKAQVAA